jgi:hypothetical protein
MRATVYVPDDLWKQAVQLSGQELNPSQLVQRALTEWMESSQPVKLRPFDMPDDVLDDAISAADALRGAAQNRYSAGYRAGVGCAAELSLAAFEALAELEFDFSWWSAAVATNSGDKVPNQFSFGTRSDVELLQQHLGGLIHQSDEPRPRGVWLDGFRDALRNAWTEATTPMRVIASSGLNGRWYDGGQVLHRRKGHGRIEAMRARPDGRETDVHVRFDSGAREVFLMRDRDLLPLSPDQAAVLGGGGSEALFSRLEAERSRPTRQLGQRSRPAPRGQTGQAK